MLRLMVLIIRIKAVTIVKNWRKVLSLGKKDEKNRLI